MTSKINSSCQFPIAKPEDVGFSRKRLSRIEPGLQKYIDGGKVPNLVTLVARHGKIVHFTSQGYMDLDSKRPAKRDAVYRLYSNSKPIAGVATLILYEEGKLNLDDQVSKYIPEFTNPMIITPGTLIQEQTVMPTRRGITIRDCLRNTTGLATPWRSPTTMYFQYQKIIAESGWNLLDTLDEPPRISYRERVTAHGRLPLSFEPGKDFEYHVGYPIIGVLIEQITGKTLEEFYQERIFKPLGMKDTSFYLDKNKLEKFTTCYRAMRRQHEWKLEIYDRPETSEKFKGPQKYFAPGGDMGGVLSTVSDYARLAQMLLNGGDLDGVRILSRKTVELMTSSHTGNLLIPMLGHGYGFGLGVGVRTTGNWQPMMRSIGAYGWGGAAGTTYFADPKEDLFAICFTQVLNHALMPDNNYQEEFEKLVYQSLE